MYYPIPSRARWGVLLAASAFFYATLNPGYVLLLGASTLVAYVGALMLSASDDRSGYRRAILATSLVVELGALFVFKYFDFFAISFHTLLTGVGLAPVDSPPGLLGLLVPAGLSFYTFSCVSYLIDVYRRDLSAERNLGHLSLYVAFFPKLIAGPIERATTFLSQLRSPIVFDAVGVSHGLELMLWGLFKKVVIADRLAVFVDKAYQVPALTSPVDLVLGTYFFAFQIYCDFSGYTDIARGAARVLGFSLMDNFRRPYLSRNVAEFWGARWHISLSRWLRDYLYLPLGGNRVPRPRWYVNLFSVFLVSGLWHGANWTFVIWGALNGIYQVAYVASVPLRTWLGRLVRLPDALGAGLSALLTFHLVLVAWVFFRAASLADALTVLSRISDSLPTLPNLLLRYPFSAEVVLSIGLIVLLVAIEIIDERLPALEWLRSRPMYVRWATAYTLIASLLLIGNWSLTKFVYMQF